MEEPLASSRQVGIGHPHIDARSLDMARIVVDRIDADSSLFNVAHENLERWRRLHGTLSRASEEWEPCPTTGQVKESPPLSDQVHQTTEHCPDD